MLDTLENGFDNFNVIFLGVLKLFMDSVVNTFNDDIRYSGLVSVSVDGTKLTN